MERSSLPRPMAPIRSGASRTITMGVLSVSLASALRRFQMTVAGRCFQVYWDGKLGASAGDFDFSTRIDTFIVELK